MRNLHTNCPRTMRGADRLCLRCLPGSRRLKRCAPRQTKSLLKCATVSGGSPPAQPGGRGLCCLPPAALALQQKAGAMCGTKQFCLLAPAWLGRAERVWTAQGPWGTSALTKRWMLLSKQRHFSTQLKQRAKLNSPDGPGEAAMLIALPPALSVPLPRNSLAHFAGC